MNARLGKRKRGDGKQQPPAPDKPVVRPPGFSGGNGQHQPGAKQQPQQQPITEGPLLEISTQARNEIVTFLDSLALAGADSRGRHAAINHLAGLKPIKKK